MTKIMLVEDDKSLREIYGVRLLAEGYDIVSAGDGEEALAMAIKERPSLIVSDVMMPKISGFDMLDILRSTTETKNIRVIMMTALSSEEQRQRGETLGADRYLVKSQVGIEDVVRVVHEVLEDQPGVTAAPTSPAPAPAASPVTPTTANPAPTTPAPANVPVPPPTPSAAAIPVPSAPAHLPTDTPKPATLKDRVITPLTNPLASPVDLNELLDKEIAKEAGISEEARPAVATTDQEKAVVSAQLGQFSADPSYGDDTGDDTASIEISADGSIKASTPAAPVPAPSAPSATEAPAPTTSPEPEAPVPPKPPTPPSPTV